MKIPGYLFSFAAIWALLAGIAIFLTLGGTGVTEIRNADGVGELSVTSISYFEMQGWWGIGILIIFAALYYAPLHFCLRNSRTMVVLFAGSANLLSILAGFSIGLFYFPGALALLLGLISLPFTSKTEGSVKLLDKPFPD